MSDKTIQQIAEQYGVSSKTISDINLGKSRVDVTQCESYPIRSALVYDRVEFENLMRKHNGNVNLVAKEYGCTVQTIYQWLHGFIPSRHDGCKNKPKPVLQIDICTGEVIHRYKSVGEAALALHKQNTGAISNAATGRSKTAYGYYWQYDV